MTSRDFLYRLPDKVSSAAIEGHDTTFHFDIDGGGQHTVRVADGQVTVSEGLTGDPACVVRTSEDNFIRLIRGELNPMMAILTGKVKISNQSEMLRYAKIFGLM